MSTWRRWLQPVWLDGYDRTRARGDLIAGLTVAVMLVPQGMAYALLGGVPPVYGLFASMVPLLAYAVFGGSRQLAAGIVALDMLIVGGVVARLGVDGGDAVAVALTLSMMVGLLHLALGLLRLGFITDFISRPVIVGFTTAAPVIIGLSQLGHLTGMHLPRGSTLGALVEGVAGHIGELDLASSAVGLGACAWLIVGRRLAPKLPHPLLVVVLSGLAVGLIGLGSVPTLGPIAAAVPAPSVGALRPGLVGELFPSALTLLAIQLMTVISLGRFVARKTRSVISPNRELCATGMANLLGGLFSAPPTSASFSRTAVNRDAGARTPLSNGFAALAVVAAALFARPLMAHIPLPALAAIIIVAALGMIDLAELRTVYHLHRAEGAVALLTGAVTLLLGIEEGVLSGIGASLFLMLYRTSRPRVAVLQRHPDSGAFVDRALNAGTAPAPEALVLRIDGALNFANAEHIRRTVLEHVDGADDISAVVLDGRGINGIDVTAVGVLRDLLDALDSRGVPLHLTRFKGPARQVINRGRLRARFADTAFSLSPREVVALLCEDDDDECRNGMPQDAPGVTQGADRAE